MLLPKRVKYRRVHRGRLTGKGLLDLLADVAHDVHKQVGADVGFCLPQDLLGRARFHEQMQDVLRPGAFDVRGELSVRERSRTAFAVLDVGVRVER